MKPTGPLTWTPPADRRAFSKALIMELETTTSAGNGARWMLLGKKSNTVNCWEIKVCS